MSNLREKLKERLRRIPLALLLALTVVVGASVVMVVQITVLPPPAAIVAPLDTAPTDVVQTSYTVVFSISLYYGQTALHNNLAALGYVSLQANTTGWFYQVNDWLYTVMRRSTGNATFTLPTGVTVDVFQYNTTHALVVNRQKNTVLITKIVSVSNTGWYSYHPVTTVYDSATISGLTRYMTYRGLTQVYVFQPRRDYITFDTSTNTFKVYFDAVSNTGSVTAKSYTLSNTTSFTALAASTSVIPSNTYYQIDINNVVLGPVWVLFYYKPSASMNSALTVSPQTPP
jgi:hypothetical protein